MENSLKRSVNYKLRLVPHFPLGYLSGVAPTFTRAFARFTQYETLHEENEGPVVKLSSRFNLK